MSHLTSLPVRVPLRRVAVRLLGALVLAPTILGAVSCSDDAATLAPEPPPSIEPPDPSRGEVAFDEACASCHTAGDGFDLALFGFSDSTILRRATAHVDTATARDIIAHVRTLSVAPVDRGLRLFQPTGSPASDDVALALQLFGEDRWPRSWGEAELLAVDPVRVALAVDFPVWSDEESSLDWLPSRPLTREILDAGGGRVAGALGAYDAAPTEANLVRALVALRQVVHGAGPAAEAPCAQENDGALADPHLCFEASRWTASLAAQHVLRDGVAYDGEVAGTSAAQEVFWDVGQAARRGLLRNEDPVASVAEAEANWVGWMMLGWTFAPESRASIYHITGLDRVGLPRHGTFVTVRSLVARSPRSPQSYTDLRVLAGHGYLPWLADATTTALAVLEAREARGDMPTDPEVRGEIAGELARAARILERRLDPGVAAPLVSRIRALSAAER